MKKVRTGERRFNGGRREDLDGPQKVEKPTCPDHASEMRYDPVRGVWACTETGCRMFAWPKETDDRKQPIVGTGKLTLIRDKGKVYIRADNNVLIDLEGAQIGSEIHTVSDPTYGAVYKISLVFNDLLDM